MQLGQWLSPDAPGQDRAPRKDPPNPLSLLCSPPHPLLCDLGSLVGLGMQRALAATGGSSLPTYFQLMWGRRLRNWKLQSDERGRPWPLLRGAWGTGPLCQGVPDPQGAAEGMTQPCATGAKAGSPSCWGPHCAPRPSNSQGPDKGGVVAHIPPFLPGAGQTQPMPSRGGWRSFGKTQEALSCPQTGHGPRAVQTHPVLELELSRRGRGWEGKVPGKEGLPQRTDGVFVIQQGLCYCTWDTLETKELIDHMGEVKATGAAGGFRV